jgi:hypothetical protein
MEERKVYEASGPAPGSLQNGAGPDLRAAGIFMPQNAEASEREGQKQTWRLAFHWEVTTYHTSTSVKQGPARGRSFYLPSDLSPGFLYHC